LVSYDLAGDVIGLQQACEVLDRWSRELPSLKAYADGARSMYTSARGRHREAQAMIEAWIVATPPRTRVGWAHGRAVAARTLNALGEYARAKEVAHAAVAELRPGERDFPLLYQEVERQLALSEAYLGQHGPARARLEALLSARGDMQNPLLLGLLHEALCEVAMLANDTEATKNEYSATERYYRLTGHPALLSRLARLESRAVAPTERVLSFEPNVGGVLETTMREVFDTYSGQDERAARALDLLLEYSNCKDGYLFIPIEDSPKLIASRGEYSPAAFQVAAEVMLREAIDPCEITVTESRSADKPARAAPVAGSEAGFIPFPLRVRERHRTPLVAVAVLSHPSAESFVIPMQLSLALGKALFRRVK
jgi:hypothetical protein